MSSVAGSLDGNWNGLLFLVLATKEKGKQKGRQPESTRK